MKRERQRDNRGTRHGLSVEERFWMKVEKTEGCWIWRALRSDSNYGRFMVSRSPQKLVQAHRLAWELTIGPIPDGLWVLHRCDNPPCVNPAHLFLGTRMDNIRDMHAKGRASGGSVPRPGEMSPNAKITTEQALEIKRRHRAGEGVTRVAAAFGISRSQVSRIATGKRWAHLMDKEEAS